MAMGYTLSLLPGRFLTEVISGNTIHDWLFSLYREYMRFLFRALISLFNMVVAVLATFFLMCVSGYVCVTSALVSLMFGWLLFRYLRSSSTRLLFSARLILICSLVGFLTGFIPFMDNNIDGQALCALAGLLPFSVVIFHVTKLAVKETLIKLLSVTGLSEKLSQLQPFVESLNQTRSLRNINSRSRKCNET